MTDKNDELLSQYLDGELNASESEQLEQRLAAEPALQNQFKHMQEINNSLKNTFDTAQIRSVPQRIVDMLRKSDARVVEFPSRTPKTRWNFAIAASIMAASGVLLVQGTGPQLAGQQDGAGVDALLAQVLESTLSGSDSWNTLTDGSQIKPLLTYAKKGGGWCREYLLSSENNTAHGVACRTQAQGQWHTEVLDTQIQFNSTTSSSTEYRTAGAIDSDQIANFMQTNAADIALSVGEEEELIATKWR